MEVPPDQTPPHPAPSPLRSVHTSNFPTLLGTLGISIAVTTYQAGKLVLLRADNGLINTHFRAFNKPMGLAVCARQLAVGTAHEIWEFRNVPAACNKLDPPEKHDACYFPRRAHVTGNVQIHEMAYVDGRLWFVNTRFSCLAACDPDHSFAPTWRPHFVSQYSPDDRCHLNGLGLADGKPRYVTALGETNEPGGWRNNKKDGGVLIDLEANQIITRKLSMPHSPRWHAGRLWLLESGTGSLGWVDLATGRYESIVELDGFTRGLDFIGNLAFVGLSQVRETAVFSGIPITERLGETDRDCGVWVIDIERGQLVAFVKFEEAVQEIFAVAALRNQRFPEVVNNDPELIGSTFILSDEALGDVPDELRSGQ